ncbi:MAG: hypothetical protein ACI4II_04540 [Acutalibacteraceae bacterium]
MDKSTKKYLQALIFTSCITVIFLSFQSGISGNDYWWHVKVGEWICNNHEIPKVDIFSWYASANGMPFTAHEWLSDIIFYVITHLFGSLGMFIFSLLIALGIFSAIYWHNRNRILDNSIIFGIIYMIILSALLGIYVYGRPQIFSFVLLGAEVYILYRFINQENTRSIYLIPIIAILWANLHGGSSNLSYILCIIVLICGLFNFDYYKLQATRLSKKQIKTLSIITVLTIGGLCINPYGVHMLAYPFQNVQDTFMWSIIIEWASPDAKEMSQVICFFLPAFCVIANMILSNRKIRLTDAIITLFFLFLFFRSTRFITFFIIATSVFAFDYPLENNKCSALTKTSKLFLIALYILLGFLIIFGFGNYATLYKEDTLISKAVDDSFIDIIKEDNPSHIFNDYNYGETLIYNDLPVFFDSRADVYSGVPIQDGIALLMLNRCGEHQPDTVDSEGNSNDIAEYVIDKYGFDAFLIDSGRPLYNYLASHPEKYELVAVSETTAYFTQIE